MTNFYFSTARVLVVGDVMLDRYVHGSTSRISPEAPVPVVLVSNEEVRVGGAGNVALNAAALGAQTQLFGLVGNDLAADQIESLLTKQGVTSSLKRIPDSSTISKLRIISRHQQLIRLDYEDHFPTWNANNLLSSFSLYIKNANALILSDYGKGMLRESAELIKIARICGLPVIVDPKGIDFERYRGATIITPNLSEFEAVVGRCHSDEEIEQRGITLRDHLDLEAVLVTRSEKGMTLLARGHAPLHLPTRAQEVFDVTGAGDTVVATLGAALGAGMPMADAVALSNIAAGIAVAKLGTVTVSLAELDFAARGGAATGGRSVYNEDDLLAQVLVARNNGESIVMTNGCFDILHPGHIDYLEKARALGGRLIVAVNDDASVRHLKGDGRPVNPLSTRLRMLAALSCVDWVVPFSEDTPERLICKLLPDVLVKGGDYMPDQIVGGDCVKAAGGEVRVLDFLPGHSTTELIAQIKEGTT